MRAWREAYGKSIVTCQDHCLCLLFSYWSKLVHEDLVVKSGNMPQRCFDKCLNARKHHDVLWKKATWPDENSFCDGNLLHIIAVADKTFFWAQGKKKNQNLEEKLTVWQSTGLLLQSVAELGLRVPVWPLDDLCWIKCTDCPVALSFSVQSGVTFVEHPVVCDLGGWRVLSP